MAFQYRGPKFPYPDLSSVTADDGKRVYQTPGGPAPSVTTILSSIPNPELEAWRERIGQEEVDRITTEAARIGTFMHDMLEHYVCGTEYPETGDPLEKIAKQMFSCIKMLGFRGVSEVWGVEVALHFQDVYAGRTDLVAIYEKAPAIIDYKNSRFNKKAEYVEKYKLQLAGYSMAHEDMFGEPIHQGVLLIGIRPNPQYNKPPSLQKIVVQREEMDQYKAKWVNVLETYYSNAA